jgi:hypothetical protein
LKKEKGDTIYILQMKKGRSTKGDSSKIFVELFGEE